MESTQRSITFARDITFEHFTGEPLLGASKLEPKFDTLDVATTAGITRQASLFCR
jgi:hypothetical protein